MDLDAQGGDAAATRSQPSQLPSPKTKFKMKRTQNSYRVKHSAKTAESSASLRTPRPGQETPHRPGTNADSAREEASSTQGENRTFTPDSASTPHKHAREPMELSQAIQENHNEVITNRLETNVMNAIRNRHSVSNTSTAPVERAVQNPDGSTTYHYEVVHSTLSAATEETETNDASTTACSTAPKPEEPTPVENLSRTITSTSRGSVVVDASADSTEDPVAGLSTSSAHGLNDPFDTGIEPSNPHEFEKSNPLADINTMAKRLPTTTPEHDNERDDTFRLFEEILDEASEHGPPSVPSSEAEPVIEIIDLTSEPAESPRPSQTPTKPPIIWKPSTGGPIDLTSEPDEFRAPSPVPSPQQTLPGFLAPFRFSPTVEGFVRKRKYESISQEEHAFLPSSPPTVPSPETSSSASQQSSGSPSPPETPPQVARHDSLRQAQQKSSSPATPPQEDRNAQPTRLNAVLLPEPDIDSLLAAQLEDHDQVHSATVNTSQANSQYFIGDSNAIIDEALPGIIGSGASELTTNFDSELFDAHIYQQTGSKPPPGLHISRQRVAPSESRRMYLHTNPMIHRMHNKSAEWHEKKAAEIKARGGRKAWFGKAVERERWLHAKNEGSPTAQPWGHRRPTDFGKIAEEDLPKDVQENPAWLKACAWHREVERMDAIRQREVEELRRREKAEARERELQEASELEARERELRKREARQTAEEETRRFFQGIRKGFPGS